jgi:sugar phosphate isomerase/epimerase
MKPSMSTLYLGELNPHQAVQLFARHGWHYLELSEGHAHDLAAQGDPAQAGEAFRQFAADQGVSFLQGHLPVVQYSHPDRGKSRGRSGEPYFDTAPASDQACVQALDTVKCWLDLFSALGVQTAVLHLGGYTLRNAGWPEEAIFERRVETLSRIVAHAAARNVTICIENMSFPDCDTETLEKIQVLIGGVGADNLGICLDAGHADMAGLDCVAFIRGAGKLLRALHIHDNVGPEDNHVLPYELQTIPWDRVLAALAEIGYAGIFNLEIPGRRSPMPVRAARLDYAKALASYMVEQVSLESARQNG